MIERERVKWKRFWVDTLLSIKGKRKGQRESEAEKKKGGCTVQWEHP